MNRRSPTSPMWAGSSSASATDEVAAAYDDLAGRFGPRVRCRPPPPREWSSPSASCATPISDPWWWWGRAASWWRCWPTGWSRLPPLDHDGARRALARLADVAAARRGPGRAAVDRAAVAGRRQPSPTWLSNWATSSMPSTSIRCAATPHGCLALDALVLPRTPGPPGGR